MDISLKDIVYSNSVVDFATVSNDYCAFAENVTESDKDTFINKSLNILSLLYQKATLLPETKQINEEENEKFVTEFDWQFIRNGIAAILGNDDTYLDFFDSEMNETPEPVTSSISENMADIYQDLKDFLGIYQLGNEELSNDAIYECIQSFRDYWGFKLVNSLRIIHFFNFKKNKEYQPFRSKGRIVRDTNKWFISKAQQDIQSND